MASDKSVRDWMRAFVEVPTLPGGTSILTQKGSTSILGLYRPRTWSQCGFDITENAVLIKISTKSDEQIHGILYEKSVSYRTEVTYASS